MRFHIPQEHFLPLIPLVLLLLSLSCIVVPSSAASLGDVIPTMYRLQLAGRRTDWMPWKHSASPRFATDQFQATVDTKWLLVRLAAEDEKDNLDWVQRELPSASDVKMQLSMDGDRFTSAWIAVFERRGEVNEPRYLSLLDANLVYWEGQIRGMQITPTYVNKLSLEETQSELALQDHFDVHYHWSQASTVDEQAGLRLVYIACFLGTLVVLGSSIRGLLKQI